MDVILILYGTIILISLITGIFLNVYDKRKQLSKSILEQMKKDSEMASSVIFINGGNTEIYDIPLIEADEILEEEMNSEMKVISGEYYSTPIISRILEIRPRKSAGNVIMDMEIL